MENVDGISKNKNLDDRKSIKIDIDVHKKLLDYCKKHNLILKKYVEKIINDNC